MEPLILIQVCSHVCISIAETNTFDKHELMFGNYLLILATINLSHAFRIASRSYVRWCVPRSCVYQYVYSYTWQVFLVRDSYSFGRNMYLRCERRRWTCARRNKRLQVVHGEHPAREQKYDCMMAQYLFGCYVHRTNSNPMAIRQQSIYPHWINNNRV